MCIGIPMQVVTVADGVGTCAADGVTRAVNFLLVGTVAPGDWVLVHAGNAVRQIDAEQAALVGDALRAVLAAAQGAPFEHLLADLIDREPQLPAHLRASVQ